MNTVAKECDVWMPYNSFWVSLLSIKKCCFPSINAYEYEHKCMYLSSFILLIPCKGQECYLDMLILYFVLILSPSITAHLFIICLLDFHIQVDRCRLGFLFSWILCLMRFLICKDCEPTPRHRAVTGRHLISWGVSYHTKKHLITPHKDPQIYFLFYFFSFFLEDCSLF